MKHFPLGRDRFLDRLNKAFYKSTLCSGRYSALNLVFPRYNRESERGRTFSVSATRLWNSLPINLKKGTGVTSFRKAIYSHFLRRYNDVDHFSLSETEFYFLVLC